MDTSIDQWVPVAPEIWPGQSLRVQPGDLSQWAPGGLGLGIPPLRPYDNPLTSNPGAYYGFEPTWEHPFLSAPRSSSGGGVLYWDSGRNFDDLLAAARLMEIRLQSNKYAVFLGQSEEPIRENYLVQLRLVSRVALCGIYGIKFNSDLEPLVDQKHTVGDLLKAFTEDQEAVWGRGFSAPLSGIMGGDGDWAKESLAFGLMVENNYQGIYRIWSRAWLVTK